MDKLVVSDAEVASVEVALPAEFSSARLPAAMPTIFRFLLAPLAFVLPVLSFATIIILIATRRKEPRIRHAWMQYCCILLIISSLLFSFAAGVVVFLFTPLDPLDLRPTVPFSLDSPIELPSVSRDPLSSSELASRVAQAVFIVTRDNKWLKPSRETLSSFGSGVLLFAGESEYLLATSRHVIDGESWRTATPYAGDVVIMDRGSGFARAQIAGRHKDLDIMLLRIPRAKGASRFAQQILDFSKISPGERIMTFGHPEGLFFSLSDGLVSRKDQAGQIQISAPISPGASGGPVYDLRGQLLGIVCSMVDKKISPHSENLNFAVRADSLLHPEQWQMEPSGTASLNAFIAASSGGATPQISSPTPNP